MSEQAIHPEAAPGTVLVTLTSVFAVPETTARSEAWREQLVHSHHQALGAAASQGGNEVMFDLSIQTPEELLSPRLDQSVRELLSDAADRDDRTWSAEVHKVAQTLQSRGIATLRNLLPVGLSKVEGLPHLGDKGFSRIQAALEHAGLSEYFPMQPDMQHVVKHCTLADVPLAVLNTSYSGDVSTNYSVRDILHATMEQLAETLGEWNVAEKCVTPDYSAAQLLKEDARAYAQKFAHHKGVASGIVRTLPGISSPEA